MLRRLPGERLRPVAGLTVERILAARSPLVAQISRALVRPGEEVLAIAKRINRFLWHERFTHREMLHALYAVARRTRDDGHRDLRRPPSFSRGSPTGRW